MFDSCDSSSDREAALECKLETISLLGVGINFDLNKTKKYCALDDAQFEQQCYKKLVEGKLNVLGQEGLDSIEFCSSLDKRFIQSCFASIREQLYDIYGRNVTKIAEVCRLAPKEFFEDCTGISSSS